MIKRILPLALALIVLPFSTYAGVLTRCPDLEKSESVDGWEVHGSLQPAPFHSVLIREARVLGQNMVICKYDKDINLFQSGNFQHGPKKFLWEWINLGGLSFAQCLATVEACSFYQA